MNGVPVCFFWKTENAPTQGPPKPYFWVPLLGAVLRIPDKSIQRLSAIPDTRDYMFMQHVSPSCCLRLRYPTL